MHAIGVDVGSASSRACSTDHRERGANGSQCRHIRKNLQPRRLVPVLLNGHAIINFLRVAECAVDGIAHHFPVERIALGEYGDLSVSDVLPRAGEVAADIVREPRPALVAHKSEEVARLHVVGVRVRLGRVPSVDDERIGGRVHGAEAVRRRCLDMRCLCRVSERVGLVVWRGSLVSIDGHRAISLVVLHARRVGAVDGDLRVVGSEAMPMRVRVREESALEHFIRRRLDARHEVGGREGDLFHLGKVVFRVSVEHDASDGHEREVLVRPHLGDIEWVESVVFGLLRRHELHIP